MWIIKHKSNGQFFYLINEKNKYRVGRTDADIILKGDTSISRAHAFLELSVTGLTVTDSSSKYGTFVSNTTQSITKINAGDSKQLHDGDCIRFGILKNEWTVTYIKLISMSSLLLEDHIKLFDSHLKSLGGHVVSKWEPDCTHLTMAELNVTVKVLFALLRNIPIVTCEFWEHVLQAARKGQTELPNTALYVPKKSDSIINKSDLNFSYRPERNQLFLGKIFVFMQKKHSLMYGPIVEMAGGTYKNLNSGIGKSFLINTNVIVIQYFTSSQSQMTQTINTISDFLEANSKRIIPEYEIGLAIVNCSIEKYCNPTYNILADLMPDTTPLLDEVLVKNTNECQNSGSYLDKEANSSFSENNKCDVTSPELHHQNNKKDVPCKRKRVFNIDSDTDEEDCPQNKKPTLGKPTTATVNKAKPTHKMPIMKPLPIVVNEKKNTRLNSDFLQKTKTQSTEREVNPRVCKRSRIAVINDDESGDENDLFNFGGSTAITKTQKRVNMEIDCSESLEDSEDIFKSKNPSGYLSNTESECLPRTQAFPSKTKKEYNTISLPKVKPISEKISTVGWIDFNSNKRDMKPEIKCTPNNESNILNYADDKRKFDISLEKADGSTKNSSCGFEVRFRVTNKLHEKKNMKSTENSSCPEANQLPKKNFKVFVKKCNYKPQNSVIKCTRDLA